MFSSMSFPMQEYLRDFGRGGDLSLNTGVLIDQMNYSKCYKISVK